MSLDRKLRIVYVPVGQVAPWDKNPRSIKTKDYERLKKQIKELGVYKPLVAYKTKSKYVVLGGNMRLRALLALGARSVALSIVEPKNEAEKIKFNLSDNDRAGEYNEGELAELVMPFAEKIDLDAFSIDLGFPVSLKSIIEGVGPDLPDPKAKTEPALASAVFIEVYCSKDDLKVFSKTLEEWGKRDGVTINIS
jgi:hypothetical protein